MLSGTLGFQVIEGGGGGVGQTVPGGHLPNKPEKSSCSNNSRHCETSSHDNLASCHQLVGVSVGRPVGRSRPAISQGGNLLFFLSFITSYHKDEPCNE